MEKLKIVLVGTNKGLIQEWSKQLSSVANVKLSVEVEIYHGTLECLPPLKNITKCSIVSPANSIIGMSGGFDNSICKLFANDNKQVENWIRKSIGFGYKPVGTCEMVDFHKFPNFENSNAWTKYKIDSVITVPTMRVPKNININDQIEIVRFVFDWVWEILCTISKNETSKTDCLIISGLGTGWGGLPIALVSKGMVGAFTIWGYHNNKVSTLDKGLLCLSFLNENIKIFDNDDIVKCRNSLFKNDKKFDVLNDDVGEFIQTINS